MNLLPQQARPAGHKFAAFAPRAMAAVSETNNQPLT